MDTASRRWDLALTAALVVALILSRFLKPGGGLNEYHISVVKSAINGALVLTIVQRGLERVGSKSRDEEEEEKEGDAPRSPVWGIVIEVAVYAAFISSWFLQPGTWLSEEQVGALKLTAYVLMVLNLFRDKR